MVFRKNTGLNKYLYTFLLIRVLDFTPQIIKLGIDSSFFLYMYKW